jgi:hypothetical protein
MHLNRDYLNYARLASMDARSGRFDRLVELGLTIELAEILLALTNEQITRIALYWPGLVVKIDTRVFECGNSLHTLAGRYHATAFLSATNSQKIQQTI